MRSRRSRASRPTRHWRAPAQKGPPSPLRQRPDARVGPGLPFPVLAREVASDLAVLRRLIQPAGKDIVDVGCGAGALVRELAALGARVTGIEISESQLAAAVARDGDTGARYLVGRAQELPLDDGAADVVVFMRSLHHVPPAD